MYVTKTVEASVIDQDKTKTTPSNRQAIRLPILPLVRGSNTTTVVKQRIAESLPNEVVIKSSMHEFTGMAKGAWHTND